MVVVVDEQGRLMDGMRQDEPVMDLNLPGRMMTVNNSTRLRRILKQKQAPTYYVSEWVDAGKGSTGLGSERSPLSFLHLPPSPGLLQHHQRVIAAQLWLLGFVFADKSIWMVNIYPRTLSSIIRWRH